MNKNLQSPTKLTEFAPLQPEEKKESVGQFISKFFKLSKSTPEPCPTIPENSADNTSQESLPTWAIDTTTEPSNPQKDSVNKVYQVDPADGRNHINVLKRISNLLALKSNNLQAYADTELKQYWMPDSVSKECYECSEKFTTFRRRHHCRVCGQIFCSQCCNQQIPGKIFGCTGDLRVCTYCCKVVLTYLQSSDVGADLTTDLRALQENLQIKYGSSSTLNLSQNLSPVASSDSIESGATLRRKISLGYQEEKFASGRSSNVSYLSTEEKLRALQNSASLRNLYEEIFHPTTGIPLQTHRYRLRAYTGCLLGSELVDWLICQQKANTRIQAAAICQALLEGGYIECVTDTFKFVDGLSIYKPGVISSPEPVQPSKNFESSNQDEPSWIQYVPQESSTTDSDTEFSPNQGRITSSSSYTLDLNVGANTVYLSRPPASSHSLYSLDGDSDIEKHKMECPETPEVMTSEQREFVPEAGWHNASKLREENGEKMAYNLLTQAYAQHEESLLKQLLSVNGLSMSWSDVITPLIHDVVDVIRPALYYNKQVEYDYEKTMTKDQLLNLLQCGGISCGKPPVQDDEDLYITSEVLDLNHDAQDIDIRQHVQFKKVLGGTRNDSKLIRGIVFSKNVAHKGMSTKYDNPKILLLQCSIVYQRQEGRLMSLEPVLMQEHEYLRHVAARIIALQPNIVLVQRTVSRLAQDLLREQGVTLVYNVKEQVLERLSRCTQADLVTSVDAHIGPRPRLGTCKKFYLKTFTSQNGVSKTLMFFEGLPLANLGGSLLVRGPSKKELVKVKKVASLFLFACYNWRLEKSFLMDEFAQPPNSKHEFFDDSKENSPVGDHPYSDEILDRKSSDSNVIPKSTNEENKTEQLPASGENENESLNKKLPNRTKTNAKESAILEKKVVVESVSDFTDPLHSYNNEVFTKRGTEKLAVAELPFSNNFRKALDDTILCISPYLVFSVPFLETEQGRKCKLRKFFPEEIYYSSQFNNKKRMKSLKDLDNLENNEKNNNKTKLKSPHPFVTAKICTSIDTNELQSLLANFRACGGRLEKKQTLVLLNKENEQNEEDKELDLEKIDVLDPNNHQKISVLFCSYSHESNNSPAFCVYPWVVPMDFYGINDIPLGCFLERYCFRTTYRCQSKTCETPMLKHIRRFVHNSGCVSLSLNSFENEFAEEGIVMWSWCTKCSSVSPVVPMSADTWSFSFAKYLELRFHGNIYSRRGNPPCQHSLHHDHYQYFGYKNIVASFKYTTIQLWEITLPPPIIEINYDIPNQQNEIIDEIKALALKGHEIYSLISEKLAVLPSELDFVVHFKQLLSKDQVAFRQKIEEVQLKLTSPTLENKDMDFNDSNLELQSAVWRIADSLVRIKKVIVDAVESWNTRLSDALRKRDNDKKKDKAPELESPSSLESKPLLGESQMSNDSGGTNQSTDSINVGSAITKKIKSLDHSDVCLSITDTNIRNFLRTKILSDDSYTSSVSSTSSSIFKTKSFPDKDTYKFDIFKRNKPKLTKQLRCQSEEISQKNLEKDDDRPPPSPRGHQRSHSDGTVLSQNEDVCDGRKDSDKKSVKNILSQLLPSNTTFTPMPPPFSQQEHYMLPTGIYLPIVVYESEPSSIIAYALNSFDYKKSFDEIQGRKLHSNEQTPSPIHKRKSQVEKETGESGEYSSNEKPGLLSFLRNKEAKAELMTSSTSLANLEASVQSTEQAVNTEKTEDSKKTKQQHIEVQFADASCNFFCRIYYAERFSWLRSTVLPIGEEAYIRSISRCVQWNARGGKSGSTFCKTIDDRFILKEMPSNEVKLFLDSAPNYFSYMQKCYTTAQPTLLGKIVGTYQIIFRNNNTNATLRTNLLVMENLFYNRTVTQKFDLKGSIRNRLVNPDNQDGEIVLLDENLLKMTCNSPLYILPHSKAVLTAAIQSDTEFLSAQSVMDYSLLVGLDSENKELVLGIIDYIRTFTWDKKIETLVKKNLIIGGQGKLPTIISPEEYQKRFIQAMHRYFLEVPDPWAGLGKGLEC